MNTSVSMSVNGKKKLIALILTFTMLLSGCATLKAWFCSSTTDEITIATENLNKATELQSFLLTMPSSVEIAAILAAIKLAIPILDKVRHGICVAAEELNNAINVAQHNEVVAMHRLGYKKKR